MPPKPTKRAKIVKEKSDLDDYFDIPEELELNEVPKSFDAYIRCFFGEKGKGKSTLAASFPKSLTFMFEPKRRGLNIRMLPIQKYTAKQILEGSPDTWKKVVNTTQKVIDDPSIECLNYDSIDIFYETCYHSVCASHNLQNPSDAGKESSAIWIEIRDEFAAYFDSLRDTDMSINLLSHVKDRESESLDGGKFDIKSPSCQPACLTYIKQAADFVFYLGDYAGKRACRVRDNTGQSWVAVSPENCFMQPNGKPLYVIEMPDKSEKTWGYNHLVRGFNNELWDIDTPDDEREESKPVRRPLRRK